MPLNINFQQILLHLLNFTILAGGLYFLLYKPVKQFMDSRADHYRQLEQQTQEALKTAEQAKQEAQQARDSLQDTLQQEREQAMAALEQDSRVKIEKANRQAQTILDQAKQIADLQKEKAMKDSQRAIRELAISAAEKLALQEDPYDQFLKTARREDSHGDRA